MFIEAPRAKIDAVIERHEIVRQLVDNGWLHLFRIAPDGRTWRRLRRGGWHEDDLPSPLTTPTPMPIETPAQRENGVLLALVAVTVGVLLRTIWGA